MVKRKSVSLLFCHTMYASIHKPPNNHSHLPNSDLSSLFLQKTQMTFAPGMPSVTKGNDLCKLCRK